jgi:hypothetical protein
MPNIVAVAVENPDEILNAGAYGAGALVRLQTSATEAGAYADVSGTGSTPTIPIVTLIRSYTGYDPNGITSSWYRSRYENSGGTRVSDWTTAFQVGSLNYTSLYDVKQDLDKTALTDTASDELLLDYIADISDYIRGSYHNFDSQSGVFTFDGYATTAGGYCLPIPRGVQSLSLVEAAASTGGSFTTILSTSYVLRPSQQYRTPGWPATELWLIESQPRFMPGYDNIRLTGVFGFGVPARVEGVARRAVVRAYASRQAGGNDLLGSGGEGGTPMVSRFISKQDREILESFAPALVG